MSDAATEEERLTTREAFGRGLRAGATSVFSFVLIGTYIGFGALAHDLDFSLAWTVLSTPLIWAGPAQVILVTTLGSGGPLIQAAIAVGLSAIRFLPMVVALLPLLKTERTRTYHLLAPAHFTAVSMWVESLRLVPDVARAHRIVFCNGIGCAMVGISTVSTVAGYFVAGNLPTVLAAAVLFLTPLSFLLSTSRNARLLIDRLALVLGLLLAPLLAMAEIQLHLLVAGLTAGTLAYGIDRLWRTVR